MTNNNPELTSILKSSGYTVGRNVALAGVALLTSILLARLLGPEGSGAYALAVLITATTYALFNFGIAPGIVYVTGRGTYDISRMAQATVSLGYGVGILATIVAISVLALGKNVLLPGVESYLILIAVLSIPLLFLTEFFTAFFQGQEDFRAFNAIPLISKTSMFIWLIILSGLFDLGAFGAILAWTLGNLLSLILIPRFSHFVSFFLFFRPRLDLAIVGDVVGYGVRAYVANLATFLSYRIDLFLINIMLSPSEVGIYFIAVAMGEKLWILSTSVAAVIFPRIATLEGEEETRREITPVVARIVLWITAVAALVLALLSEFIVGMLYGSDFQLASNALVALLPGIVMLALSRILANDIAGRGKPEINSVVAVIAVILNVFLNLLLIPRMGIVGAALASSITYSSIAISKIVIYSHLATVSWYRIVILQKTDLQMLRSIPKMLIRSSG